MNTITFPYKYSFIRERSTDSGSLTLSDGVPAGDAVLLGMSPTDSFQSEGFRDALPLVRVGHPASLASEIEKNQHKNKCDTSPNLFDY